MQDRNVRAQAGKLAHAQAIEARNTRQEKNIVEELGFEWQSKNAKCPGSNQDTSQIGNAESDELIQTVNRSRNSASAWFSIWRTRSRVNPSLPPTSRRTIGL